MQGQWFEPWTDKKDHNARPGEGVQTLDRPKRFMHAIANAIACMIVKINVCTKAHADAPKISTWNVFAG